VNLPGTSNIDLAGPACTARRRASRRGGIPESVLQGKRDLVILDVTLQRQDPGGLSARNLERYLADRKINKRVVRLAFSLEQREGPQPNLCATPHRLDRHERVGDSPKYYGDKYEGDWDPAERR